MAIAPSIPETSAANLIPLFLRVRASRKPPSASPSARPGPPVFRHSEPYRSVWLPSTSASAEPSVWNLPGSEVAQ